MPKNSPDTFEPLSEDEKQAIDLLCGYIEPYKPIKGPGSIRFSYKYFKSDSQQERDARKALARLLRSDSLTPGLREHLAALFDSTDANNRLVFKRPRQSNWYQDRSVVASICGRISELGDKVGKVKIAKQEAADEFGIGDETIRRIWRRRKSLLK